MGGYPKWLSEPLAIVSSRNEVVHKSSGNKLGYGELAAEASTMPIPASDKLRLKEPFEVPLYRQGRDRHRRPQSHRQYQAFGAGP
jgi:hypothetical protein